MYDQMLRVKDCPAEQLPIVLAGNKMDLENEREVHKDYVEKISKQLSPEMPYIECSAKTRLNVDEVFTTIVKQLRLKINEPEKPKKTCVVL
jgi:GTPase SAR1 family protein